MRVLIVEDERDLASAVGRGLRRDGLAVDEAYDGDSGLEKALVNEYDVIILDRNLPRLHGDDVCRQLRAEGIEARVIMLTAAAEIDDRVAGLNLGADDYLPKPFAFEELRARVHALASGAAAATPARRRRRPPARATPGSGRHGDHRGPGAPRAHPGAADPPARASGVEVGIPLHRAGSTGRTVREENLRSFTGSTNRMGCARPLRLRAGLR